MLFTMHDDVRPQRSASVVPGNVTSVQRGEIEQRLQSDVAIEVTVKVDSWKRCVDQRAAFEHAWAKWVVQRAAASRRDLSLSADNRYPDSTAYGCCRRETRRAAFSADARLARLRRFPFP